MSGSRSVVLELFGIPGILALSRHRHDIDTALGSRIRRFWQAHPMGLRLNTTRLVWGARRCIGYQKILLMVFNIQMRQTMHHRSHATLDCHQIALS